jgi:hypothetical protein
MAKESQSTANKSHTSAPSQSTQSSQSTAKKSHTSAPSQSTQSSQSLQKSASTQSLSSATTQPAEDPIVIDGAHTSTSDNKKAVSPEEKLGQSFDAYINDQLIDFTFTAKLKSTWRSPVYTFFKTD